MAESIEKRRQKEASQLRSKLEKEQQQERKRLEADQKAAGKARETLAKKNAHEKDPQSRHLLDKRQHHIPFE